MTDGTLRFLCVGAGRDGTFTVAAHINEILQSASSGGECVHELFSRELYELQCDLVEWPERPDTLQKIRDIVASFSCAAVSGNGYAAILSIFADLHPSLKLIHLRRRDKRAFIASQVRNSQLFPETYINYSTDKGVMRRIAAFHTGEMTRAEWFSVSLEDKFDWFYEYTHRHITAAYPMFPAVLQIDTEDLNSPETLRDLAAFVSSDKIKSLSPRRLNGHALIDVFDFPAEQRTFAQWMFGRLDCGQVAEHNTVLVDHIMNSTIAWLGYLQTGFSSRIDARYSRSTEQVRQEAQTFLARLDFYRAEVARLISVIDESK